MGRGLLLGGAGYIGYFLAIAHAVRLSGPAVPPLVIGLMPVVLAVIANSREGVLRWRRLLPPLALIATGALIVNSAVFTAAGLSQGFLPGLVAAVLALAIWVIYGLVNSASLQGKNAPDALQWTVVQGLGAGIGSLCLWPLTSPGVPEGGGLHGFILWVLVMGIAGSWLATWFWGIASRRLSLVLAAQLIVAETVFGLIFGFAFEGRWPMVTEALGALVQIAGVCLAIWAFQQGSLRQE